MPRKILPQTHLFPYHVVARSNNKERFSIPLDQCWRLFQETLLEANVRFHFQIHAFVLMSNHYHLICSCSKTHPVSKVMEWFQRSVNRKVHHKAGRINHLFGGPFDGTLIKSELYYYNALKYLYQNPVAAGMTNVCQNYKYSTLQKSKIPVSSPSTGIESMVPTSREEFENYINKIFLNETRQVVAKSFKKSEAKFPSRLDKNTCRELNLCI